MAAKRILIVDDDPSIRHMLGRILRDENYEVLTAANGGDGLNSAAEREVDLVLLDLKMPGIEGCEVLKALGLSRPGLPVIVITAWPRQQLEAGMAGVGALLQKPLDFLMLLETIKNLLAQAGVAT